MAEIIAFPVSPSLDTEEVSVSEIREIEILAETLTELQMNLGLLHGYLVQQAKKHATALSEARGRVADRYA